MCSNLQMKLSLGERSQDWDHDGSSAADAGYPVNGLPEGESAEIAQLDGVWKFYRKSDTKGWRGEFGTPEEAVKALESEIDSEVE